MSALPSCQGSRTVLKKGPVNIGAQDGLSGFGGGFDLQIITNIGSTVGERSCGSDAAPLAVTAHKPYPLVSLPLEIPKYHRI